MAENKGVPKEADTVGETSAPTGGRAVNRRMALGTVAAVAVSGQAAELKSASTVRDNVTDCRPVGDGLTDDTACLQAAIDRAHAGGGGIVSLPVGNFRIAGTLYGKPGVSIIGQGSLASKLLKVGSGNCLVYGSGNGPNDEDVERISLERFAVIGRPDSGHLFWGRKTTTAFVLRDLYFEGGNGPVVLDTCYSLTLENVQVRGAETGDNISINAISHNVLLLQVASQIAKAGAGIGITGCNAPLILGGKLEFNKHDQLRIGGASRGVVVLGLYIEGIQPTATGFAGIAIDDADTVLIEGGFFDATQGDPGGGSMGADGTGTYVKARGRTSRLLCMGYGFGSIAATQRHVEIGRSAHGCDVVIPFGASFVNDAPKRNIVRFSGGEDGPLQAVQRGTQAIVHNAMNTILFSTKIDDLRREWDGKDTFIPRETSYYSWSGFIRLSEVPMGSYASVILYDATNNIEIAQVDRYLGLGSPSVDFLFREPLMAGQKYQIRLLYADAKGRGSRTLGGESCNRMTIDRMR